VSATPSTNSKQIVCAAPDCTNRFTPWRAKIYCTESCKRKAQNERIRTHIRGRSRGRNDLPATHIATTPKPEKLVQRNQTPAEGLSTYGPAPESLDWIACNEVTLKCVREGSTAPLGWAILVETNPGREAWFGRISVRGANGSDSSGRSEFSFGPTTKPRAKAAVEARLTGRPFAKSEDKDSLERMWSGTCWSLMSGHVPAAMDEAAAQ
jgi:hypothetical protein